MKYTLIALALAAGAAHAQSQADVDAARMARNFQQMDAARQEKIDRAARAEPAPAPRDNPWWYWLAVPGAIVVGTLARRK